jgi:hypothetical protein
MIREPPIDLVTHDSAVGQRMVESAEQRSLQVVTRPLESLDLGLQHLETIGGDLLPLVNTVRSEHAFDVVEREASVLQHPDEHQPSQRFGSVAPLSRHTGVGGHQPATFVVAHRRRGDPRLARQFADRELGVEGGGVDHGTT